jgi:putative mycofactocin binding protein MftB
MVTLDRRYRLNKDVRVRVERFGLLFYDRRGPYLFFVGSKGLIDPGFFQGRETPRELIWRIENDRFRRVRLERALTSILARLEQKGLIDGV